MNRPDKINTYQAKWLANRVIRLVDWHWGLSSLIEQIQERNNYDQYRWVAQRIDKGDFEERRRVALWCIKVKPKQYEQRGNT